MQAGADLLENDELSDRELIAQVRAGDKRAFGDLYERHHDVALRAARKLSAGSSLPAEDCVADAFAKILAALQDGKGPDEFFRSYLYAVMRNAVQAASKLDSQSVLVDDFEIVERNRDVPVVDPVITKFETQVVRTAFSAIPEQWQSVLWYSDVEGMKPAEIAPILGLSSHGVSMLRSRAREGLRTAYLQAHLSEVPAGSVCAAVVPKLGMFGRSTAPKRDLVKISAHLVECPNCTSMVAEVKDINRGLILIIGPLFLGGSSTAIFGYGMLATPTTAASAVASSIAAGVTSVAPAIVLPAVAVVGVAAVTVRAGASSWGTKGLIGLLRGWGITSVPQAAAVMSLGAAALAALIVVPIVFMPSDTSNAEAETPVGTAPGIEQPDKKFPSSDDSNPENKDGQDPVPPPSATVPGVPASGPPPARPPTAPQPPLLPPVVAPPQTPVEVVANGGFGGAGFDFRNGSYKIGEQFAGWTVLTAQPGLAPYGLQVWSTSVNNEGLTSAAPYPNGPWAGVQGRLGQQITTTIGANYRLSYLTRASAITPFAADLGWGGGALGGVEIDGLVVDTFQTVKVPLHSAREVTFTATKTTTEVVFYSVSESVGIDDVSITRLP